MKKLYFKEKFFKITDHYPILDEDGREAYYLDQDFKFLGYRSYVSDKNGHEILNIDRKLISWLPKYTVSMADGSTMVVERLLSFLKHKVNVHLENESLHLVGDFWRLNFTVENGQGKTVGVVNKKFFALTDTYELTIYDEKYIEELIGLVICLNNMIDLEQAAASSSSN